jgi:hypothetical protein
MSDMLALLPADTEPELLFFCHFLNRLPAYIRDNVAAGNHKTAEDMAEAADRLWDAHSSNPVASLLDPLAAVSLSSRSQSPREGRRSPDCGEAQNIHMVGILVSPTSSYPLSPPDRDGASVGLIQSQRSPAPGGAGPEGSGERNRHIVTLTLVITM